MTASKRQQANGSKQTNHEPHTWRSCPTTSCAPMYTTYVYVCMCVYEYACIRKPSKSKTKRNTKTSKRINNRKKQTRASKQASKQRKSDNKQQQNERKQTTKPTK